jgi:signal transduction histidine kinase/CheY-like chemotaxis protein
VTAIAHRAEVDARVLLLAPTRKDADTTATLLRDAAIAVQVCAGMDDVFAGLAEGAGVVVVAEEAVTPAASDRLVAALQLQPPWSDLPVLILAHSGADSAASRDAVRRLGNVTLLERPLRATTLLSAVRSALRARQRQCQIREHLAERAHAEETLRLDDRRKDEFLATLGHELRNPLAPLQSSVQMLRLLPLPDPRVGQLTAVMERQLAHLVRLVDDLLEVSRITRGMIDVRHDPLDLIAVLKTALETSRPAIDAGRHRLVLDLPDTPILVSGDAVRLTQVFANLLTNAAKYTNAGGQLELSARQRDGIAAVSVRDNGIGIAALHLATVFDMFMQVDRSARLSQGGLGIGLTLVRSLVTMHGGRVFACSDGVGKGSEFVVELPLLAGMDTRPPDDAAPAAFPHRRVLVVDDNRDAAETLGLLLERLGAVVAVAHSGRVALERLVEFRPSAVLLDIGMPDMDGYEVARRIRALPPPLAGVRLIALTGWGQDHDQREAWAAGFDHHMVKPPDLDELRRLLAIEDAPVARGTATGPA